MLLEKIDTPETNGFIEAKGKKTAEGLCCSCSKRALCKTTKCKCRSTGESCKTSCGCTLFKCQNRELNSIAAPKSDSAIHEMEDGSIIASEGAKLLQNALVEKPAHFRDNPGPINKPLSDIQNSLVFSLPKLLLPVFFPLWSMVYPVCFSLLTTICRFLLLRTFIP